jgi:hypothetical protein
MRATVEEIQHRRIVSSFWIAARSFARRISMPTSWNARVGDRCQRNHAQFS